MASAGDAAAIVRHDRGGRGPRRGDAHPPGRPGRAVVDHQRRGRGRRDPGRDAFLSRLSDPGTADEFALAITQIVTVDPHQVLAMVEIRARRGGRTLHNHAAFLVRVEGGAVTDFWMVEALPAYSAEFWS